MVELGKANKIKLGRACSGWLTVPLLAFLGDQGCLLRRQRCYLHKVPKTKLEEKILIYLSMFTAQEGLVSTKPWSPDGQCNLLYPHCRPHASYLRQPTLDLSCRVSVQSFVKLYSSYFKLRQVFRCF